MQRWVTFGDSEIGPAHVACGRPNQDAWASFSHCHCDALVVSDGLGSKDFSELGSALACRAVDQALRCLLAEEGTANLGDPLIKKQFLDSVRDRWLDDIAPLTPSQASATCLFAYYAGEGTVWVGMLGDGLVAAVLDDGDVRVLSDSKEESFSNMTQSLSEQTTPNDWQIMGISESRCKAVLLCTDGVADDLVDVEGFARGFVEAFYGLPLAEASAETACMLIDWPTPKHSDDKTVACFMKREYPDE